MLADDDRFLSCLPEGQASQLEASEATEILEEWFPNYLNRIDLVKFALEGPYIRRYIFTDHFTKWCAAARVKVADAETLAREFCSGNIGSESSDFRDLSKQIRGLSSRATPFRRCAESFGR